jgi:hypothetical protein
VSALHLFWEEPMTGDSRDLLLTIARCPVVKQCMSGDTTHPCATIVRSQGVSSVEDFQSPEPWSGRIDRAPILFVSSNPSISPQTREEYPTPEWNDTDAVDYFNLRFGGSPLSSIIDGIYGHVPGGTRAERGTRFWIAMRARAGELLGKRPHELSYGNDYALTEVVHCKSRGEFGVSEAVGPCVDRYLMPVLNASVASVMIGIGAFAESSLRRYLNLPADQSKLVGPVEVAGKVRYIAFLPHPSGWGKAKTFASNLSSKEMQSLRDWIQRPIC